MSPRERRAPPISLFSFQDIITSVTGVMVFLTLFLALELTHRMQAAPPESTAELNRQIADALRQADAMERRHRENLETIRELRDRIQAGQKRIVQTARFDPERNRAELAYLRQSNQHLEAELRALQSQLEESRQRHEDIQNRATKEHDDARRAVDELHVKRQALLSELDQLKNSNRVVYNVAQDTGKQPWLVEIGATGFLAAAPDQTSAGRHFGSLTEFLTWINGRDPSREFIVFLVKPSGVEAFDRARRELSRFQIGFDLLAEEQSAVTQAVGGRRP
jgi:TolA-binding protein